MRKTILTLLLACVAAPVWAGVCQDCPDPGPGGGGGAPPPAPPPFNGQPYVSNGYANDPNDGVLESITTKPGYNSLTIVVDKATDRIYMNNGGALLDRPLSSFALDVFPNDAAARANFLNRVRGGLTGAINVNQGTVTGPSSGQSLMPDGSGVPRAPCSGCYFVVDTYWSGGAPRMTYDGGGWVQNQLDIDRALFEYRKNEACNDKASYKATYATSIAAAFVACYQLKNTAGAAWAKSTCGLTLAGMLIARDQLVDANQTCAQTEYPGPGRWQKD